MSGEVNKRESHREPGAKDSSARVAPSRSADGEHAKYSQVHHLSPEDEPNKFTEMSAETRRNENLELLQQLPPRKHPMRDVYVITGQDVWAHKMRKAVLLVEKVHDDGSLPPAAFITQVESKTAQGQYYDADEKRNQKAMVGVRPETRYPLSTAAHEMGHHLARNVLPSSVVREIAEMARSTQACRRILHMGIDLNYWMKPEEVFCRIYSQYVLTESKDDEAALELERLSNEDDSFYFVWKPKEFARLQEALVAQLKKIGYL